MSRGRIRGCAALAVALAASLHATASADLLAGWHFNGMAVPVTPTIGSDHGNGTIDLTAFNNSGLSSQTGTDINAWPGDAAGDALGFAGTTLNGKSAVVTASTIGYAGVTFSFAARRTSTGFASSVVEVWDGESWLLASTIDIPASTWTGISLDLSRFAFLDAGAAKMRIRLDGATSGAGALRLDNIRVEAPPILPAPGGAVIAGAAAALVSRRRRG